MLRAILRMSLLIFRGARTVSRLFAVMMKVLYTVVALLVLLVVSSINSALGWIGWSLPDAVLLPSMLLLPALGTCYWLARRYVIGRQVEVDVDEAKLVKRRGRGLTGIFHGTHQLAVGDRVIATYSLRPTRHEGNEEALNSRDRQPLRVRGVFKYHIADPQRYHLHEKKCARRLAVIARQALVEEVGKLGVNDLWNCAAATDQAISRQLSRRLNDYGLVVSDYHLAEVVLPARAVKWQRDPEQASWEESHLE